MKYYLAKFEKDWADEFSVSGFVTLNQEEKDEWDRLVAERGDEPAIFFFGTNEGWEDDTVSRFCDSWEIKQITESEYSALSTSFGGAGSSVQFGTCPTPDSILQEEDDD